MNLLASRGRRALAAALLPAALVAPITALIAAPAGANPAGTGLVINEVYGAGGNSGALFNADFVELYNPTASAIDLAGLSIQYRSAGGGSGGAPYALSGSVPAGSTYLIRMSNVGANGAELPTPNATASPAFSMAAAGGQVLLVNGTEQATATGNLAGVAGIVDMVGATSSATSYETSPTTVAGSATNSLNRSAGADTDVNSADFTTAAPSPTPATQGPSPLSAATTGDKSGQVGIALSAFTLSATGGTTPYSWTATGLPAGVTISSDGTVSGTPEVDGSFAVTATVTDSASPAASATTSFTLTISPAASLRTIAEIQGAGATTPFAGEAVVTQGVVTAAYPTGGLNGFYIQTPGEDTTPGASDGIFVYGGTSGFSSYPAIGDSVRVRGTANEFSGQTQISAAQSDITPVAALGAVVPKTQIAGADCALPGTDCQASAGLDQAREAQESELLKPTTAWTVTDSYDGGPYYSNGSNSSAFRGEIGLAANSDDPLVAPTEVIDAQDTAAIAARKAYNDAHRIILDDGSSWTYSTTSHASDPFPWFTRDHTVRVGAGVTFDDPVVFTYGFNAWRVIPQGQVVGKPTGITFEQNRPAAPEPVGGNLKLATFNVLNFFPTTGEEFVASGAGTCTYYTDRAGARITNNRCDPDGPRGAADDANLGRQRAKIVAAINTADADVVSLEELENSVKFGKDRDFAISELVKALNADAGAGTWAYAPSPATLPPLEQQDVIRNGFIYQPAAVALVGKSVVLSDESAAGGAFEDAREPLAQGFKMVGTPDSDAFAVIVNHFKSKGSGTPDPYGQGNATDRRVLQAESLVNFAQEFKTGSGITKLFLAGDFNAYSKEDPIQVLEAAGYTSLDSTSDPKEESYNFDGQVGSLDHVLANDAARGVVTGVDIWEINANESVYYEYSRFNYNATNLYDAGPFRSSDHNPEIVGIKSGSVGTTIHTPKVTATVDPGTVKFRQDKTGVTVAVTSAGKTPTGAVEVWDGAEKVGSGSLHADGQAYLSVGPFDKVGIHTLTVKYLGDTVTAAGEAKVEVDVVRAKVKLRLLDRKLKFGDAVLPIAVRGFKYPRGKVVVKVIKPKGAKHKVKARLGKRGKVKIDLKDAKFKRPGKYIVVVKYRGNSTTLPTKKKRAIWLKR
ncbi:MAG: ExeM/NucH family extracellular endonuclease [Nocardioides sp.]|jgi:5'-nucleotidase